MYRGLYGLSAGAGSSEKDWVVIIMIEFNFESGRYLRKFQERGLRVNSHVC